MMVVMTCVRSLQALVNTFPHYRFVRLKLIDVLQRGSTVSLLVSVPGTVCSLPGGLSQCIAYQMAYSMTKLS